MECKNILIPTDGKRSCEDIIDLICSIQRVIGTNIHVIYVIEVPRNLPLNAQMPDKVEYARASIERALKIAEKHEVMIHTSIIYARTVEDSIISTAEDLKCDVIAIAQDNHKLRIFANSAANIYQKAKCNVWLFNNKT
ncbi:MAG: universal stress protein [Clostridia bacterium]|nr:universal stress protein [Clostridia bacterium]